MNINLPLRAAFAVIACFGLVMIVNMQPEIEASANSVNTDAPSTTEQTDRPNKQNTTIPATTTTTSAAPATTIVGGCETFDRHNRWCLGRFSYGMKTLESGHNPIADSGISRRCTGLYQICATEWASWSGLDGLAMDHDPHVQEQVATKQLLAYFDQFGDWGAVGIAWFAGPDDAQFYQRNGYPRGTSDGNNTIAEYMAIVLAEAAK